MELLNVCSSRDHFEMTGIVSAKELVMESQKPTRRRLRRFIRNLDWLESRKPERTLLRKEMLHS
jgi:hypothetical protein